VDLHYIVIARLFGSKAASNRARLLYGVGESIVTAARESMQSTPNSIFYTPDGVLFLRTICRYFHGTGEWPILRWLERELLDHQDIDVLELEYRLQREMFGAHCSRMAWEPTRQVKLTVSAIALCLKQNLCPEIKDDLDAFISTVRLCVKKYYDDVEPLTITNPEVCDTLNVPEIVSRKMFLLVEFESSICESPVSTLNSFGQILGWKFQISRNIRVYRKVRTLDDYLIESDKLKPKPVSSGRIISPPRSPFYPTTFQNVNFTPIKAAQTPPVSASTDNTSKYEYDVAISFAGPQRELAEQLATLVKNAGYRVFYDRFYMPELWGEDLTVYLDEIYRKKARYCVAFFSKEYIERMWTTHERKSAAARMVAERGNKYLLPIMVEHVEVPGIPPSISYLSLDEYSISEIADILIANLQKE
jgi:TIR domain-containing protein